MGYRSDLVIAINKECRMRHLIQPHIPKVLLEDEHIKRDECKRTGALYFRINDWKFYDSYPEVQAIKQWFDTLANEEFGAMRMGEDDDDLERWGEPYDYDINLNRWLSCPVDD